MYTILIVEDDKSLSNGIALALRDPELTFVQAFDIQNAAELYKTQAFQPHGAACQSKYTDSQAFRQRAGGWLQAILLYFHWKFLF